MGGLGSHRKFILITHPQDCFPSTLNPAISFSSLNRARGIHLPVLPLLMLHVIFCFSLKGVFGVEDNVLVSYISSPSSDISMNFIHFRNSTTNYSKKPAEDYTNKQSTSIVASNRSSKVA